MKKDNMSSSNDVPRDPADRIQRVESKKLSIPRDQSETPLQLSVQKLMELYKVPGLSVAVIDNFKIAWVKGYGVREAGTSDPVTPRTLFQSGSVSKVVTATGALALVQQGILQLDEEINNKLKSWKLPENEFTRDQKVTLRRILSHTAGLTVHGFPGYEIDGTIPTLVQILSGEPPANTDPIQVDTVPGTIWRYSGGGTLIAQQLMIDVTGKPFPQLMHESVFDKIGMEDSTFEQPLPLQRQPIAASGTYWNGTTVRGKWHVYPEMAAGGLWSTPSDLAKLAIEIALSYKGESNLVLSRSISQEMLSPQTDLPTSAYFGRKENPSPMGLGFFLGEAARPGLFGHTGDDAGFQATLIMDRITGQGAAVMVNSEMGTLLYDFLVDNIAEEYNWKNYVPAERARVAPTAILMTVAQSHGIEAALAQYQTLKDSDSQRLIPDQDTLVMFGYLLMADTRALDALEALKLAVREYPQYWNAYDTLAEVYATLGEKQLAIQNYERSIEMNPDNRYGIAQLKKLQDPS